MRRPKKRSQSERYDLSQSPLAQRPTQRTLAALLGESRDDLRRLVNYKEQFIVRRAEIIRGKSRQLAYPVGRLRVSHQRLKFHFDKVKQRDYLFSPRIAKSQRDNAALHAGQQQYLGLDIKQFYPSTTSSMVRRWLVNDLGMYDDVAGLITHLVTIDGKVSLGSPLTPVLCSLIHRRMFDEIHEVCRSRGLRFSVWVDDLTISGRFVPGEVLQNIRDIVRAFGLKSHRVKYHSGKKRPIFITGVGVYGEKLLVPHTTNVRVRNAWKQWRKSETHEAREAQSRRLLTMLGGVRHIVGANSDVGRRAADQMHSLRQKRDKFRRLAVRAQLRRRLELSVDRNDTGTPF